MIPMICLTILGMLPKHDVWHIYFHLSLTRRPAACSGNSLLCILNARTVWSTCGVAESVSWSLNWRLIIYVIFLSIYCQLISWYFSALHARCIFQQTTFWNIFSREYALAFYANCLLMRRKFEWNVQACFLGKVREYVQFVVYWNSPEYGKS